tara:strand:- start:762 stop:950 length:189 start_codon:yes stop_codon:yes gene_type:complete
MIIATLDEKLTRSRYEKLISNCDKAISRSGDEWSKNYWTKVKEKLKQNMSELGLLKSSKLVN